MRLPFVINPCVTEVVLFLELGKNDVLFIIIVFLYYYYWAKNFRPLWFTLHYFSLLN
jgi:hypothetical protein